jgi:hypothetical protein
MIRYVLLLSVVLISQSACEKNITIKLDPTTTNMVVDASIENGRFPVVTLSRSLNYFSKISLATLDTLYIHDAVVTMSNGQISARLIESSTTDSSGIVQYFYTFFSSDTTPNFKGEFSTQYYLQIQENNQTYTATTTIPTVAKKIDSLWWIPATNTTDTTLVTVEAKITDPPGYGNYTRYFTSVNNGPYYPGLTSVYDDQITDGTTYTVAVAQGVNRNVPINSDTYGFFHKGDQVILKYCNIDKATYDFWRTMEYNYQSIGNPFSSPTTVISNISNGALGYFGGYAAQYKQFFIP